MWLGLTPFPAHGSTLRGNLRTHGVSLMATDSATATLPAAAEPDPTTYFWQVPIFLIGAAVFVAAWQGWLSLGTADPGEEFARDLAALRIAAERVTPDRDELNDLLAKIAVQVDNFPEQAAFAQFILGSGYARLAELNPSPEEARRQWNLARQHFELLHDQQLSDPEDRPGSSRSARSRRPLGSGYPRTHRQRTCGDRSRCSGVRRPAMKRVKQAGCGRTWRCGFRHPTRKRRALPSKTTCEKRE